MTRLSKEDWEQLETLLSKHGFGGYYDLLECLKTTINQIDKQIDTNEIKDLPTAVQTLMRISKEGS